jgi:hypothetical protein
MQIIDKEIAPGLHLSVKIEGGKAKLALEEDVASGAVQLLEKAKGLIKGDADDAVINVIEDGIKKFLEAPSA